MHDGGGCGCGCGLGMDTDAEDALGGQWSRLEAPAGRSESQREAEDHNLRVGGRRMGETPYPSLENRTLHELRVRSEISCKYRRVGYQAAQGEIRAPGRLSTLKSLF